MFPWHEIPGYHTASFGFMELECAKLIIICAVGFKYQGAKCCSVPLISSHSHGIIKWFGETFKGHVCSAAVDKLQVDLGLQVIAGFFLSQCVEAHHVLCPSLQARNSPHDICRNFLIDFAKSDPAQDFSGQKSELFKGLIQACKIQTPKTHIVAGSPVDQAVNSTFAALVYLTPDLFEKLQKYGNSNIIRLS